jgi:hypothetical protein
MKGAMFINAVAKAYRVNEKTVTVYARNLKEAGLMTTGARGVNAPDMTPRDAAIITIALLATDMPARAVERTKRLATIPLARFEDLDHDTPPDLFGIRDGITLLDALTHIFEADSDLWNDRSKPILCFDEFGVAIHYKRGEVVFAAESVSEDEVYGSVGIRRRRSLGGDLLKALWIRFEFERKHSRMMDETEWEEYDPVKVLKARFESGALDQPTQ